ncbi:MAG: YigZ family protein, partial [Bacteroidota bacterium]
SKFIAYCFPAVKVDEVNEKLLSVRKLNPKARHHCYAYRIGIDKNNFRANDDGEPSGTAGKPILGQIDSFGLTNVVVIVVRYFGGVLLGTGGLINAYREAAKDALVKATIVERKLTYTIQLNFDYSLLPELMTLIKRLEIKMIDHDYTENCFVTLIANKKQIEKLKELRGVRISIGN